MAEAYALTRQSVEKIKADLERLRTQVANLEHGRLRGAYKTPMRDDAVIGKASGNVNARSGTSLSSGSFTIQTLTSDGDLSDSGRTEIAWNLGDDQISSGDYLQLERDYRSGRWVTHAAAAASGGGSAVREISYVKAQGYWTYTGSAYPSTTSSVIASVQVKKSDLDGTESGSAFTCYLPITNTGNDPNVIPGQIFLAAETEDPSDSTTSWSGISGYEDAAIGTVRMMAQNNPSGPSSGWAKMDGTDNADLGSGVDMTGAVPKHDCSVSAGTSNGGTADPSTTTGATAPSGTTTTNVTGSSGTLTTSSASGTTGAASGTTGAAGSHTHTVSVSGTTGGSGTLTTSTHSESVSWAEPDYSYLEEVAGFNAVDDDGDGEPDSVTHNHTISSHTHTFSDSATTSSSGSHTHTIGSHTHSIGSHDHTLASHTHTIPALSVTVSSHTHTTQKQLTKTLCFYERIDNSDFE